jgi:hypothetical protein
MNEKAKIKGEWTIIGLSEKVSQNNPIIQQLQDVVRGKIIDGEKIITDLRNRQIIKTIVKINNMIPDTGFEVINRLLAGDNSYSGEINYIALGSGNTAFTSASIKLNTETFRKVVSSASFDPPITYVDLFIDAADVGDQTFHEVGAFIDGTITVNSGMAFSLAVQDIVKAGSVFISYKLTLSEI